MIPVRSIPTIVVPVCNRATQIIDALDSIHEQSLRPLRVIVVDDGSTDSTPGAVEKWIQRNNDGSFNATLLITEKHSGASAARNAGLRLVESEYVMFFDSDDIMLPGHMERVARALDTRPETDMLRWEISRLDTEGWISRTEHNDSDPLRLHIMHATYATVRFAVRTSLIRQAGGWDERLSTWDDLELGTRLLARGPVAVKLTGEPTVRVNISVNSLTGPDFSSRADAEALALDIMEEDLKLAGKEEYIPLVDARRMILAANLAREKSREASLRMRKATVRDDVPMSRSLKLLAVYAIQRMAGHGGSAVALASLSPRPTKKDRK